MSISSLPKDVLLEVFTRLSLRSLMRLRCVSKSWHALIDSPEFVQMHMNQSSMHPGAQRYVFGANCFDWPARDNTTKIYTASFDSAQESNITLEDLDCSSFPNIPNINKDARLVGSSNGLLCVVHKNTRVIFWNPWIRKGFVLPKSPVQRRVGAYPYCLHLQFGFGYDNATDDYKVLRIAHNPMLPAPTPIPAFCEIKLYSQKSNSWKKLQNIPFSITYTYDRWSGVLSNGAFHWIVDGDQIGAIHTRTEEHKLLKIPESLDKDYRWKLGILDGCLCMFPKSCGANGRVNCLLVQLWVMKHYGVEDSWTKLAFELPGMNYIRPQFVTPIGWYYAEGMKQLVLENENQELLWYDIGNRRLVETTKVPGPERIRQAYHCVCSLVHPDGGGRIGRTRKGIKRSRK